MNQNESNIDEHLLLNYLLGKCTQEEVRFIELWLEESSAHREILDKLESVWVESGKLDPPMVAVDVDRAWNRVKGRISDVNLAGQNVNLFRRSWVRAAAMILLLVGLFALYKWITAPPQEIDLVASTQIVTDTLSDGSVISLNKGTVLTYPDKFSGDKREVKLRGSAFFNVHHDEKKPFVIDAGIAKVKVLGTSFLVNAYQDSAVEVVVTKGRVLLFKIDAKTKDTSSILITAGEKGVVPLKTLLPELVVNRQPDDLFWIDHTLEFRKCALRDVFILLKKYYSIEIEVINPDIENCMLSATFMNDPIDRILEVISLSFDLKAEKVGNKYIIHGDGCKPIQ